MDRAVDMIISGGVNIYPAEIEEVLYGYPDLFDVSIIGVPDPDWGEKIVAYVVKKENAHICKEDIIKYNRIVKPDDVSRETFIRHTFPKVI